MKWVKYSSNSTWYYCHGLHQYIGWWFHQKWIYLFGSPPHALCVMTICTSILLTYPVYVWHIPRSKHSCIMSQYRGPTMTNFISLRLISLPWIHWVNFRTKGASTLPHTQKRNIIAWFKYVHAHQYFLQIKSFHKRLHRPGHFSGFGMKRNTPAITRPTWSKEDFTRLQSRSISDHSREPSACRVPVPGTEPVSKW